MAKAWHGVVWYGDAVSDTRRAELFAGLKRAQHDLRIESKRFTRSL